MKRCPTFHCCRILDFNVFSYELANFKMAQLSSNMKMCYPILVTGNIIVNTFDLEMGPDDPGLLFSKFSITKVQTWKCPVPAARWSRVKLFFLLKFLSHVMLTIICVVFKTTGKSLEILRKKPKKWKWYQRTAWGSFQNDRKITENIKKKNPTNENGINPFQNAQFTRDMNNKTPRNKNGTTLLHNAAYWGSFQMIEISLEIWRKKIQEMKMARTHFTMKPFGTFFKMKGKSMGIWRKKSKKWKWHHPTSHRSL